MQSKAVLRMRGERSAMTTRQRAELKQGRAWLRDRVAAARSDARAEHATAAQSRREAADAHLTDLITTVNELMAFAHESGEMRRAERSTRLRQVEELTAAFRAQRRQASQQWRADTRRALEHIRAASQSARFSDFGGR